jgi:hypothetical protein
LMVCLHRHRDAASRRMSNEHLLLSTGAALCREHPDRPDCGPHRRRSGRCTGRVLGPP